MTVGRTGAAVALATTLLLASCSSAADPSPSTDPSPSASTSADSDAAARDIGASGAVVGERVSPDLDLARSTPVEDSVYPEVGGPDVDALLYDLDLAWEPKARTLTGTATITFRAARDAPRFALDLAAPLQVSALTLDGEQTAYAHRGKNLVVKAKIVEDDQHELVIEYAGRPRPEPAPTVRSDFSTTGFTVTEQGEVWTMQEPYGAYSWYPVNDQPADKALYDISVTVPEPWTGVANGRLVSDESSTGQHTTAWQLDEPAASYLITLAIGDYAHATGASQSGVTLDYWYPRDQPTVGDSMQVAGKALDWIEWRLGPYPFSSAGIIATDSQSAMETQTLVTIGNNDYVRSPPVIVHELVHQWFGDQVTPSDWRDVWLNEGMTMLLQALWTSDHQDEPLEDTLDLWRSSDQQLRRQHGPPGAYNPQQFGESNVYYPPALMWNELRLELGDDEFFAIARAWLAEHDNTSVSRDDLYAFWEQQTGLELSTFFDAWIMGKRTPPVGLLN